MSNVALITGITGQDGYYLTRLLLEKGYTVHGIVRPTSEVDWIRHLKERQPWIHERVVLHTGDLTDATVLQQIVAKVQPSELYHLAAQSHVGLSCSLVEYTAQTTGLSTTRLLEAVRTKAPHCRFFQASSAELFGDPVESPQSEETPFRPRNPYGCAKVYAYWMTVNYREAYGLFAANGILFNHESPLRPERFVTRKITAAVARIRLGLQDRLDLESLDACRDWGYAGDYAEAMWRILQHDTPDDFVVATGQLHSVQEFCELAFGLVGLDWKRCVRVRPSSRSASSTGLPMVGNASKIRRLLGWWPRVSFPELVQEMVEADLRLWKCARTGAIGPK